MARKKTHEEFVAEVKALVGDEYTVVGVYRGTDTPVEIRHNKCGKSYTPRPSNFKQGKRCKYCGVKNRAGKRIKNTTPTFIEKIKETEFELLSDYIGNMRPVKLKHRICGRVFTANACNVLKVSCPRCIETHPKKYNTSDFRKFIAKTRGSEYELVGEYTGAHEKTLIKHVTCGFIWDVAPNHFKKGRSCPKCQGLLPFDSKALDEFLKLNNLENEYQRLSECINNKSEVEFRHITCGTTFKTQARYFKRGTRCVNCGESKGERVVREFLSRNNMIFEKEGIFIDCRDKYPLRFDYLVQFKNFIVAIEYDGEEHFRPIDFFGGDTKYLDRKRKDAIKDKYCADHGIPLIRIPYWEYDNIDAILTEKLLPLLKDRAA